MTIIQVFFFELNRAGVRYVHFKSNTELDASFAGRGDFDILVGDDDFKRFESILTQFGARRFETVKEKRYPYVCSWLIYDMICARIYHIHLHKRLVTGKEYVKDYVIPWHDLLLDTRILDPKWNIYIAEPTLELILLAARAVVKSKSYDRKNAKRGEYRLHKDLNKERLELQDKLDSDKLAHYCELLFPDKDCSCVIDFSRKEEVDSGLFLKLSQFIRENLAAARRMSPLIAEIKSRVHSFSFDLKRRFVSKYDASIIAKKVMENHKGLIVALVGVDGSGKSTNVKVLSKWLGSQVDCKSYFMGEGSGKTGKLVGTLKKLVRANSKSIVNTYKKAYEANAGSVMNKSASLIRKQRTDAILRALIVVLVQRRNKKLLKKMDRYRRKGGVSFTDRYPQMESPRMNDGLKVEKYLEKYPSSLILKLFQKLETAAVRKSIRIKPDVVFRLNISSQTSMMRKPDQRNIAEYQEKIDRLKEITFNNSYILDVDAEQPYEKELLLLTKNIWALLTEGGNA